MLSVINIIRAHKHPPALNEQLSKILLDEGPQPTAEKFDGWYHFIEDAVTTYKRQKDAFEWVKDSGGCKYDHALWKAIASHIHFRTKRHPDLEAIKTLERAAVNNCDYILQLAYNCMMYEAQLRSGPDKVALDTLREITSSIV